MSIQHTSRCCRTNPTIQESWSLVLLLLSCDFLIIKSFPQGDILGLDFPLGSKIQQFCGTVNTSKKSCIWILELVFSPNLSLPPLFQARVARVCGLTGHTLAIALWLRCFTFILEQVAGSKQCGHAGTCEEMSYV